MSKGQTLKRIDSTRWASRADAVSALKLNYQNIKEVLIKISMSEIEKPMGKLEAKKLATYFDDYETALLTTLWDKLLQRINYTNKSLQNMQHNLLLGTSLIKSLSDFFQYIRNDFDEIEKDAQLLTENHEYKDTRRKKRKLAFGEKSDEINLGKKENFVINIHNYICDSLISEVLTRSSMNNSLLKDFQLFFNFEINRNEFNECVERIILKYNNDIDSKYFKEEIVHFVAYLKSENITNPIEMYKLLIGDLQCTFPNVETILRIFLTLPICNASGERSFSVLKRVKNNLRNSLRQDNLNHLSMMFIENDVLKLLDCNSIIDKFASSKARKVPL
jgi:hypothetical protein